MIKLKDYRLKIGLKQSEVAERLGLKTQTYENYELGRRQPDYSTLLKLADFFNVSLDDLFDRENKKFLNVTFLEVEQQNIIKTILKLNRENLLRVDSYALACLEQQIKEK